MRLKDFDVLWWLDQSAHKRTYAEITAIWRFGAASNA